MSSTSSSSPPSLYPLNPSDVNVEEFVTVKLCEKNYFTWRSMMLSLIQSYDLLRFTNEKEKNTEDWKRTDELLRGWIRATINENMLVLLEHSKTTRDDFVMLDERLTQPFQKGFDKARKGAARDNSASTYLPLMQAALNGDWEKAVDFLKKEPDAVRAVIGGTYETALMVAARSVQRINFLRKLVEMLTPVDLAMVGFSGRTSLHMAAMAGNVEAAKLLVEKNRQLPNIVNMYSEVPLVAAAVSGKREMVLYLLPITKENSIAKPFQNKRGCIYDIALSVVQRFPELAVYCNKKFSPLRTIAGQPSAFPSGAHFNFWERRIYSCVPVKMENLKKYDSTNCKDIESAEDCSSSGSFLIYPFDKLAGLKTVFRYSSGLNFIDGIF